MRQPEMQFKENANVFDENGEKVGTIDRVVIDPRTRNVSHVVVHKGFLFTKDRVVPVDWFTRATEEAATLNVAGKDVDSLPPFEEVHYVPWYEESGQSSYSPGDAQPYYWYPRAGVTWWGYPGYRTYFGVTEPPYATYVERSVPEGTVALEEGADVISDDGKHVGDVDEVLIDPDSERATHFVISKGLIFKDRKLVPTAWIKTLAEDTVYLSVDASFLDSLESYGD